MANEICILCGVDGENFIMYQSDVDGEEYPLCGTCQQEAPYSLIQRRIQNARYERNRRGINI